jgi:DnaJ-class molecular chaperone
MSAKIKVIKTIKKAVCGCCFRGEIPNKKCKSCKGTGKYKDYHYIMIVGKVAYDMDTLK